MRPSPLVLLALVAVGFALIAVPLARLTGAEGASRPTTGGAAAAPAAAGAGLVTSWVRLRFAHPPLKVTLSQDGRSVAVFAAPADAASGLMEQACELALPPGEVIDLLVEATWPGGTPPTALGVEVEPDGQETRRATVWTEAPALTELLTFSWK